jgi:phage FluMu gp28-like protein/transposase-like protein
MARWNKQDIELIKEFINSGKSISFIAAHFDTSPQNIRMVMSRNNLAVKKSSAGKPTSYSKRSNDNLAIRLMQLQGLERISDSNKDFFFSDEDLHSWIDNPKKFASDLLKVNVQDYQEEMLENFRTKKRVCICAGRGTGKSFTVAIFLIYNSIVNPNQRQLIISPTERQSKLLFNKIHEFIAQNDDLFNSVNFKSSNQEILKFSNGSEIIPLPSTTFIRGFQNVDFVVCDEAAFFLNPEQVFASIEPMLSIKNERTGTYGSMILISSPNGVNNKFFESFNSALYSTMQISSSRNKFIDSNWLEEQKALMPIFVYEQEILAQFKQSLDNFFSVELLQKVSKEYSLHDFPDNTKKYFMGIDWGRIHDSSVFVIVSEDEGFIKVENIIEMHNKPFSQQIAYIIKLHERYRFRTIVAEWAGLSIPACEKLKENDLPVEYFKPTIDNKEEAYNNLKKRMENEQIIIPKNHQKLQFELRMFQYQITASGKTKLFHLSQSSDDFCDALNYAVWAAKRSSRWDSGGGTLI